MSASVRRLSATAVSRRMRGETVRDQSLPVELFALRPAHTTLPPLVLLGGMGPIAGANGFARACAVFGESREIVLLQACSVPDRTQAALADIRSRGISPEHVAVVHALEAALSVAIGHVTSQRGAIDVIILCNAAHAFLPNVFTDDVRLISLADCVLDALRRRSAPALILSSLGTRVSRIFTRRLDAECIRYVEPSEEVQEGLTRAIYAGIKALDRETACAAGTAAIEEVLAANPDLGCIVAGCTEIPEILDLLRQTGSPELRERLSRLDVIDPVELALGAAR